MKRSVLRVRTWIDFSNATDWDLQTKDFKWAPSDLNIILVEVGEVVRGRIRVFFRRERYQKRKGRVRGVRRRRMRWGRG